MLHRVRLSTASCWRQREKKGAHTYYRLQPLNMSIYVYTYMDVYV